MRIISGKFKGRRFEPLKNLPVRPTTDFAKEALFNILENKCSITTSKVLDLFAGTGNISIEFVSRGSTEVVAVENNGLCIKSIQKTIHDFEIKEISTRQKDVMELVSKPAEEKFDIIFADPPFEFSVIQYTEFINNIIENEWLNKNGILIIEHSSSLGLIKSMENKIALETRKYGSVSFSFFYN